MMSSDPEANGVPVTYAGVNVLVKKINHYKKRGQDLTYLTLATMTVPLKLSLNIEPAIATCEIADCKKPEQVSSKSDKFDRLKKAKELLDSGAITQEEYDKEKAKILADN